MNICGNCEKDSCKTTCSLATVTYVLLIIGGLNWGLVGVGILIGQPELNLVSSLFAFSPELEAVVYLLVAVSALVSVFGCRCKKCKMCCSACEVGDKGESK